MEKEKQNLDFFLKSNALTQCFTSSKALMDCRVDRLAANPLHDNAPQWLKDSRANGDFIAVDPRISAEDVARFKEKVFEMGDAFIRFQKAAGIMHVLVYDETEDVEGKAKNEQDDDNEVGSFYDDYLLAVTENKHLDIMKNTPAHEAGHALIEMFTPKQLHVPSYLRDIINLSPERKAEVTTFIDKKIEEINKLMTHEKDPRIKSEKINTYSLGNTHHSLENIKKLLALDPAHLPTAYEIISNHLVEGKNEHKDKTAYKELYSGMPGTMAWFKETNDTLHGAKGLHTYFKDVFPTLNQAVEAIPYTAEDILAESPEFKAAYEADLKALVEPKSKNSPQLDLETGNFMPKGYDSKEVLNISHYLTEYYGRVVRSKDIISNNMEMIVVKEGKKIGGEFKRSYPARNETFSEILGDHMIDNKDPYALRVAMPRSAEYVKRLIESINSTWKLDSDEPVKNLQSPDTPTNTLGTINPF